MICIQCLHDYDSCCLAVTPLQSGIFSNRLFSCINVVSPYRSENFLPLSQQTSPLGMYILDQVYSTTWLGQALPPFTTKEYTLAPFDFRSFQSCLPHSDVPDGNRLGACSEVCYCGPCAAANSSKAEFHVRTALRGGACCALPRFEYFDFLLLTTAQAVLNSSTYQHRKSDSVFCRQSRHRRCSGCWRRFERIIRARVSIWLWKVYWTGWVGACWYRMRAVRNGS
jgi:hypothetical protein